MCEWMDVYLVQYPAYASMLKKEACLSWVVQTDFMSWLTTSCENMQGVCPKFHILSVKNAKSLSSPGGFRKKEREKDYANKVKPCLREWRKKFTVTFVASTKQTSTIKLTMPGGLVEVQKPEEWHQTPNQQGGVDCLGVWKSCSLHVVCWQLITTFW